MDPNVAMFKGHVFVKFEFLVYISVNRIVMLGNEYFDNLGRYCFKKYNISDLFQSIGGD